MFGTYLRNLVYESLTADVDGAALEIFILDGLLGTRH